MINTLRKLSLSEVVTYLQVLSLWFLIFVMPFRIGQQTRVLSTVAIILAVVLFFAEYIVNKRWTTFRWTRNSWLYVAMIAFYLFVFIWHIGTLSSSRLFTRLVEQRIPFLLCGIIGLLGFNPKVRLRHVAYAFIISSILVSLYIILWGVGIDFFIQPLSQQTALFVKARIAMVNSHMVFNLFLNTSLICIFYLLHREVFRRKMRILLFVACGWIYYIIGLTEGRIGLITALFLGGVYILIYLYRISKTKAFVLLAGYVLVGALLIMTKPRLQVSAIQRDPRVMIWQASWETIQEHPIVGQGVYDARMSFIRHAAENVEQLKSEGVNNRGVQYLASRVVGDERRVHPHNAFLEAWSEFGVIGLLTLLFLFVYPMIIAPRQTRIYVILIVCCFGLQYLFDVFLSPMLYCIVILCFTSQSVISQASVAEKQPIE